MKKKFYVISLTRNMCGLISIVTSVMNHIIYALENDMIPVVDLKHYDNLYFKDGRKYKDNAWEYFFKQPCNYTLDDIEKDEDTIVEISNNDHEAKTDYNLYISHIPVTNDKAYDEKLRIIREYYKKYLRFSDEMQKYLDEKWDKFLLNHGSMIRKENILGVLCRGTDYTKRRSPGEHIQPQTSEVIRHIKKQLDKNKNIEKIYLATEDAQIYDEFKAEFKDMLLENNQYMYRETCEDESKLIGEIKVERENHHYLLAKEYLASLYILSKLNYFIAGKCNGSLFVWMLLENPIYLYIYQLGNYPQKTKNKNSLIQNIFSVRNSYNKTHKVLTIAGIQFKFKKAK